MVLQFSSFKNDVVLVCISIPFLFLGGAVGEEGSVGLKKLWKFISDSNGLYKYLTNRILKIYSIQQ